jgi:2-polyprenyl-3-methyl-5-hydroxy-6-metoxy-1,4-benzoquinol methylase
MIETYQLRDGIHIPPVPVAHREEEYASEGFQVLSEMQRGHFWYRGRNRFLLHAVHRHVARSYRGPEAPRVVDLGGGCGGWVAHLAGRKRFATSELALADSSTVALRMAADQLPEDVGLYQADLLALQWEERWEVAFLLDVLEHIPQDAEALSQIFDALSPGGLLFVTTPALRSFWTWNDEIVGHQRRYSRADFRRLADDCGYRLLDARYFMFFLSPLLLVSRLARSPRTDSMSKDQLWALLRKMHRVPNAAVNTALAGVFGCETPLGHHVSFPWGTSILAVLQKPAGRR